MHTWALFSCSGLLTLTAYNLVQSPDAPKAGPEPEPEPSSKSASDAKFTLADRNSELPEHEPTVVGPDLPDEPQLSKLAEGLPTYESSYNASRYPESELDLEALLGKTDSSLSSNSRFATYRTEAVQPLSAPRPLPSAETLQSESPLGLFAYMARERAIAAATAQRARYPLTDAVITDARPASLAQPEMPVTSPAFAQAAEPATAAQNPAAAKPAAANVEATNVAATPTPAEQSVAAADLPTVPLASTQELPPVPAPATQSTEASELAAAANPNTQSAETAELPTVPVPDTQSVEAAEGTEPAVIAQAAPGTELAVVLPHGSRGELFAPLPEASVETSQMAVEVLGEVPPTMDSDSPVSTALMQTVVMRHRIFTRLCEEARAEANAENIPAFCDEVNNKLAQSIREVTAASTPIRSTMLSSLHSNPSKGIGPRVTITSRG